jgi:hypothetical protein
MKAEKLENLPILPKKDDKEKVNNDKCFKCCKKGESTGLKGKPKKDEYGNDLDMQKYITQPPSDLFTCVSKNCIETSLTDTCRGIICANCYSKYW